MGFADAYLHKAGLREKLIAERPHPRLKVIVTIPAYNESGLERCLDSLFLCNPGQPAEVVVLVNAPRETPAQVLEQNLLTVESARSWIANHPHPHIVFHLLYDPSLSRKEAGVGLARKIVMDEAVRRFSETGNSRGIIASLDADTVVDPNYLEALEVHFTDRTLEGCSLYFEHPLEPGSHPFGDFPEEVYRAITLYELHLRTYLHSLRSTGYPYAFHTIGSAFAVRADVYCMEGGMNRRKGGEDFYFIQKVAQRGHFSECNATRVVPSPRPSPRVPFGTGRAVVRYLREGSMTTSHPEPFRMLHGLFSSIDHLFHEPAEEAVTANLPPVLAGFLASQGFREALAGIRANSASPEAFGKRFWRWFNMFRILKFLHHAREMGFADVEVEMAARERFDQLIREGMGTTSGSVQLKDLLERFREMDRTATGP